MAQKGGFRLELSKTNCIFIISDFWGNFDALRGSADFGRFKSAHSDLAHISTIFGQKHSVGCFSHTNKTTEPDSVIGIGKFQEFWNSSESVESPYKYLIFGPFC